MLIASCDRYSDVWRPFFRLKSLHWKQCPYPTYLGSESKEIPDLNYNFQYLHVGKQTSWTAQMRAYLNLLPYEYILLSLEDFFLRKKVDQNIIDLALMWLHQNTYASSFRLNPLPRPTICNSSDPLGVGEYSKAERYRVSTQAGFWRKKDLIQLLGGDRSPWEFELKPEPSASTQRHFGSCYQLLPYRGIITHHVIEKGHWIPHEYFYFRLRGIIDSKKERNLLSPILYLRLLGKILARRSVERFKRRKRDNSFK
jgi:hypothetical protein